MQFRAPRGTADLLPQQQKYWRHIERTCVSLSHQYGFSRLDTPVFESSGLFDRSVGAGTDIVEKETYTFADRGGDLLTLRPEGTAPVCRAYLEHGMHNLPQPVRLYYFCPVFRYERPQAGRYREHHQFGLEVLGDADPSVDAEVIELAWRMVAQLGLTDVTLYVNSIGDRQCRPDYIAALRSYYQEHHDNLCVDCRQRLDRNPLRLLDCKREGCRQYGNDAPRSVDHLCDDCQTHWDRLRLYLSRMQIPYQVDHRLVRGLDYYTRTVFEIQPLQEGGQSTLVGGGRYDGLIEQIGGKPTPGIGFATGMERLTLNLQRQEVPVSDDPSPRYLVVSVGDAARETALDVAVRIRQQGTGAILGSASRSLKGQLRQANALSIPYVAIIGDDEVAADSITIRDMATGGQERQPVPEFLEQL